MPARSVRGEQPHLTRALLAGVAAFAIAATPTAPVAAQEVGLPSAADGGMVGPSFAEVVEEVLPAVVSVRTRALAQVAGGGQDPFQFLTPQQDQPRYVLGQGSAFFISADGYLVTNNHVVAGAQDVSVVLTDGSIFTAQVVGTDERTDLALIKVDADREFPFVEFAADPARIGEWGIVIGNPFGLGGSVSAGIISALGRDIGAGPYDDFIQLDAPINRGNSGGPTFNTTGQVIGVNTAIFSTTGGSVGIGFAIPAYVVRNVVNELAEKGFVERGWLGVTVQPLTEDIAAALDLPDTSGALIVSLVPDAPAAAAGLESGDVILAMGGDEIDDSRDLTRTIAAADPGAEVQLTVWRDGSEQMIPVTLGLLEEERTQVAQAPPQQEQDSPSVQGLGLAIAPSTAVRGLTSGVVVVEVQPNGQAAERGLQPGDVLLEIDGQPVSTPEEATEVIRTARDAGKDAVLVLVRSGDAAGYIAFDLEELGAEPEGAE